MIINYVNSKANITFSTKDIKRELLSVPLWITGEMLVESFLQGNSISEALKAFSVRIGAGRSCGGFEWCNSKFGYNFWHSILTDKLFSNGEIFINNIKNITPGPDETIPWYYPEMPIDVIRKILMNTWKYKSNKSEVICTLYDTSISGLFVWRDTPEKYDYWYEINKQIINFNNLKNKENENQLQRKNTSFRRTDEQTNSRIIGKKGKSAITIRSLSYRRISRRS